MLDGHSFWARGRSRAQLRRMLSGSQVVVSAWRGKELVGFGRATSDGVFRAVLWDVVVAEVQQGQGLGRRIVEELLASPAVAGAERVYLMTTTGQGFYERLGFRRVDSQRLMLRRKRMKRFELSTLSLARRCSTTELHPQDRQRPGPWPDVTG